MAGGCLTALQTDALANLENSTRGIASQDPGASRDRRRFLVPGSSRFHYRSEFDQSEQRKRQPGPTKRSKNDALLLGHYQHEPLVLRR